MITKSIAEAKTVSAMYSFRKIIIFYKENLKKVLTKGLKRCIIIKSLRATAKNGSLAQLGEHLPYKQRVIGSSPIVPTIMAR